MAYFCILTITRLQSCTGRTPHMEMLPVLGPGPVPILISSTGWTLEKNVIFPSLLYCLSVSTATISEPNVHMTSPRSIRSTVVVRLWSKYIFPDSPDKFFHHPFGPGSRRNCLSQNMDGEHYHFGPRQWRMEAYLLLLWPTFLRVLHKTSYDIPRRMRNFLLLYVAFMVAIGTIYEAPID